MFRVVEKRIMIIVTRCVFFFLFLSGLWLDYIRLELQHPCGKPDTAGELYWRATKSLDGEFTEEFVGLYSLLRADRL